MELQTQRLRIIPCTDELLSTISPDDYKIYPHMENYVDELNKDSTLLGWGVWLVISNEDNTIIGDIGFKGKPTLDQTVEIGYGIIPAEQKKGYATEAVKEIIKWAFSFENVNKIVAECLIDNSPSIKVLEKLGMKIVGIENKMLRWQLKK